MLVRSCCSTSMIDRVRLMIDDKKKLQKKKHVIGRSTVPCRRRGCISDIELNFGSDHDGGTTLTPNVRFRSAGLERMTTGRLCDVRVRVVVPSGSG